MPDWARTWVSHGDGRTVPHRAPQLRDPRPIQRMMAPSLNSCSGLFPRAHARSDDPEADDGPDTARPPAEPPIHPLTGRFADSEHTIAYRSKVFRMMMPLHVVGMALGIWLCRPVSTGDASLFATEVVMSAILVLGLGARVAVHHWEDKAKAQHLGAMAWTITIVLSVIPVRSVLAGHEVCRTSAVPASALICALFAFVNATHGMEFWHTSLLVGLVLCDLSHWRIKCGDSLPLNLAIVLLVVVHAFCHFNTLLSRHTFLETDYLHTSRERLEYDFQRLECGMHRLEAKLPAGGSAPTESSESTSTASGRAPRSTQSAPGRATRARGS